MNKNKRIIWTNDDYDEWRKAVMEFDGYTEEQASYEQYYEDVEINLQDERSNLNEQVNGCIVAFAYLGLWDGIHRGAKVVGTNVRDILSSSCDYVTWYCDRYNVRCDETHHDGTNSILYRVAKDNDHAERLVNAIAYDGMTEEQFRKATRSLRSYVAKVYGW